MKKQKSVSVRTPNNMRLIQHYIKENLILIMVIVVLVIIGIGGLMFFNTKILLITKQSEDLVNYNKQMGELFITWQEHLFKQNQMNARRDSFIIYASDIIIKHYIANPSRVHRPMTSSEIIILVDAIYNNSQSYGIDPFLPLAFARVESDFYPDVLGLDGEKSIYQFMMSTAENMSRELHIPWNENFWRDPTASTQLWFAYYKKLSMNFVSESEERTIKWTSLAYNAGLYRNQLRYYFDQNAEIETYLRNFPIRKGISTYYKQIYDTYIQYKSGFEVNGSTKRNGQ